MTFRAVTPIDGSEFGPEIHEHSEPEVANLITAASIASVALSKLSPTAHGKLLRAIARAIEAERPQLIEFACKETALPEGRINGEITRTTVQFNLFAEHVESSEHLSATIDKADPQYSPAPRPDIRKVNTPLGVVAIFAASNFPLAFSVAGGDAASAIAAGNAVVAKAHPAHPNTCATIEKAVKGALVSCGLSPDLFSIVQGRDPQVTHWLVNNPLIEAVGFTGSEKVGRILIDLAAKREKPIPVFAEMGSLNPVFITSAAITESGDELARNLVDSALLGSGQFCTKPGLIFTPSNSAFIEEIKSYLQTLSVSPLLSQGIASQYSKAMQEIAKLPGVEISQGITSESGFSVTPTFIFTTWGAAKDSHQLFEEHFGPTTVIVSVSESEYVEVAGRLQGQLTATIQASATDEPSELLEVLTHLAGRVIWNGLPTGVAVTRAMNHGGPWPASSTHTTSVGIDAINRFMRPVSYQGVPEQLLPPALQDGNPWKVQQRVN